MNSGLALNRNQSSYMLVYFLETDSLVVKVAVVLAVIVLFLFIFRLGVLIMGYAFAIETDPYLFKGTRRATKGLVINQDPSFDKNVPILRSVDEVQGLEFSWSIWLLIEDFEQSDMYKHVFHKGNLSDVDHNGKYGPNNAPGVYLSKGTNALEIVMNTFDNPDEILTVSNIPVSKWFNLIIRIEGNNLEVYINGIVVQKKQLTSVPKQNYDDVHITKGKSKGFNGYISDLRYFDHGVSISDVNSIMRKGPDLTMSEDAIKKASHPYFSNSWFLNAGV